jgi:hypothetical protein
MVNDGNWHHIAVTRDSVSGQMNLFVDGSLLAYGIGPPGPRTAPPGLRIGSMQTGTAEGFLPGTIDDVQLFDYVFSPAQVPTLMNHSPILSPISDTTVLAGRTLLVTNTATDPDLPAQMLTFSLAGPPSGATISSANGLLTWRPSMAQSGATYPLTVQVADNGSPSMTATQNFSVTVQRPAQPVEVPQFSSGVFGMQVSGDLGPDYQVYVTTNLNAGLAGWNRLLTTNPAALPFQFLDLATKNYGQRFYRVLLGP